MCSLNVNILRDRLASFSTLYGTLNSFRDRLQKKTLKDARKGRGKHENRFIYTYTIIWYCQFNFWFVYKEDEYFDETVSI